MNDEYFNGYIYIVESVRKIEQEMTVAVDI